eukprot:gene1939-biopygen7789
MVGRGRVVAAVAVAVAAVAAVVGKERGVVGRDGDGMGRGQEGATKWVAAILRYGGPGEVEEEICFWDLEQQSPIANIAGGEL